MARRRTGQLLLAAALALAAACGVAFAKPKVVSLNLCTDQLVMLIAEPEQILSLSYLSRDPELSYLHAEAHSWPINRGLAEEALDAGPDVVVTGTFSLHNTTLLLRRLGMAVEEFRPPVSLAEIRTNITRMGALLDQRERAAALVARFDAALEENRPPACAPERRPTMLTYGPNGITNGTGTLADAVMEAAGFANIAGINGGMGFLALEQVLAAAPDLILLPELPPGTPSLAEKLTRHPALRNVAGRARTGVVAGNLWSCGGPFTAQAVSILRRARAAIPGCPAREAQR